MSADNWTQCPRCLQRRAAEITSRAAHIETIYGTVTAAEYEAARAEVEKLRTTTLGSWFREDYEIGMQPDGTLSIGYSGSCSTRSGGCGLVVKFAHEAPADLT